MSNRCVAVSLHNFAQGNTSVFPSDRLSLPAARLPIGSFRRPVPLVLQVALAALSLLPPAGDVTLE